MNKNTLFWTLIVAVPVGLAALATAYVYRDTGKLPFQETTATTAAPETANGDAQPAASAEAPAVAEQAVKAQAEGSDSKDTAPQSVVKGPSFDVVGVEPTGETVVAGRSDAGAIVALTANGKVVGKSIANEIGEWTIILDEPLKPGDYDVSLEVHDEAGAPVAKSEEHVVVSLPEGGKEQPLVVLNTPGSPSDILQKPAAEQQVAGTDPGNDAQGEVNAGAAADAGTAEEETTVAALQEPGKEQSAPEGTQQADAQPAATAPSSQTGAEPASAESAVSETKSETAVADAPAPEEAASVAAAAEAAGTEASETVAAADTAPAASGSKDENAQPASAAAAPEGQGDSAEIAAVPAEDSGTESPSEPQAAAVDEALPQTGEETAGQVSAVAAAAQEAPASRAEPTVTVEAVESEQDKVFVAGTGEPGSSVRVYVGDDFQGEATVNASGKWLVQGSKNIAEGNVEVRADLIAEDGKDVDARAAVTFEKEQDKQIVLTKVVASGAADSADGQGAEVKKSLPVVIIRKGDNLWRISRRLYGEGVRYTTIYQANQDQIRNPDLIYPGQVFLTPEGDLNWQEPVENNG